MDTPVSAFAVYNANKKPNKTSKQQKKKKIKKQNATSPKTLPLSKPTTITDDKIKIAAKKLKQKQNKNSTKVSSKKKSLKKKKPNKKDKIVSNNVKLTKPNKKDKIVTNNVKPTKPKPSSSIDIDEDVPLLIPAPKTQHHDDESASESSTESFEFIPVQTNSIDEGLKVFRWMMAPYDPNEFFCRIWERKPLHISRKKGSYYKDLISTPMIDNMLRTENILYGKNIDITSYVNEVRETHNPAGRAHPHVVWDYYLNGCSIRLLNPQTYLSKLHLLNASLQEFFNSFVGANAYLTPPDSQGFAPHYDDIEAFILQVEGKKHWKVYKPRSENEVLPRVSSKNFDQDEIGEPILEMTLEAGDMLYFPRGYIHQGVTIDGEHSLHVTISMYQKHTWADLLEKMIPAALQAAINENVDLRRGLPLDLYDNFGLVNSDINTPRKQQLIEIIKCFTDKIKEHLPIEEAVDEMGKKFQHDALPPILTDAEKAVTVYGDDTDLMIDNGKVVNRVEIGLETRIRLLRKNIIRMVMEDTIKIYYHTENSLEYHGNDLQYLEIDEGLAPAIETLILSYPEYVFVENLNIDDPSNKLQIATDLWEKGLIMTEYPLDSLEDE